LTGLSHRRLLAAALVSGLLLAGCGGGSAGSTRTTGGATATEPTVTAGGATSTASPGRTRTTSSAGSRATAHGRGGQSGPLAFSKCMRANGVSSFPDPSPGGGFAFHASGQLTASPAFRRAQAKCQGLIGGGPLSPGHPPSAETMALLRRIASCMREHHVPQFPDPLSTPPPQSSINMSRYIMITNYMGAILLYPRTIDMQSPAYEQAVAACHAGFLAGQNAH
jgi:hypothetical protein